MRMCFAFGRIGCCSCERREIRYLGPVSGLSSEVDYREVKLPGDIMERAKNDAAPRPLDILPGVFAEAAADAPWYDSRKSPSAMKPRLMCCTISTSRSTAEM